MNLNDIALPFLHLLGAESAHNVTVTCLKKGLYFRPLYKDEPILETCVWGKIFPNPIGLAAGFDKNAQCYNSMIKLGMGFVEVGSITPKPQEGNPKPRVFRLPKDRALLNRYGFNSLGIKSAVKNLRKKRCGIVGVNLGKNKTSDNPLADFVMGAEHLAPLADYLVINVSSPNTPGLRILQQQEHLKNIVCAVQKACLRVCAGEVPPLLVKLSPDLDDQHLETTVLTIKEARVDGIIVSNTTISRPSTLRSIQMIKESGGLSGKPLFEMSTKMLKKVYTLTNGTIPLVGVGGVSTGREAYVKILNGASLIQLYSALTYGGAGRITNIKKELAHCLKVDGLSSVAEAVGRGVK